jgi:hypothetical protein
MPNTDILLDEDGDLLIKNGDFVIGPSDKQHVKRLLISEPGHIKANLLTGGSLRKQINGVYTQQTQAAIKKCLESDGYKPTLTNDGELTVSL